MNLARMNRKDFAAVCLILIVGAMWLWRIGIDHHYISFSDGVYSYLAREVARHGPNALYTKLALSQPPIMVLLGSLAWKVHPAVESIRALVGALWLVTSILVYTLSRITFLPPRWACAAGLLTIVAPMHAQFAGLDGEALLAPLAVTLAIALHKEHEGWAGVIAALGLFVKLTWLPIALAAFGFVLVRRTALWKWFVIPYLTTTVGMVVGLQMIGHWRIGDLLDYLVTAQSNAGFQPAALLVVALVSILAWLPLVNSLVLYRKLNTGSYAVFWIAMGSSICVLFSIKEGTFFNVAITVEPLLAICTAAFMHALFVNKNRLRWAASAILGVFCISYSLVAFGAMPATWMFPKGTQIVHTNNQDDVDMLVKGIHNESTPTDDVFLNPLLAVLAHRNLVGNQADWFILHALESGSRWRALKAAAVERATVIGIDKNVSAFDPQIKRLPRAAKMYLFAGIDSAPLRLNLYARKHPAE